MATEGQSVLEPLWQGLPSPGRDTLSGSATCTLSGHYEAVRVARNFTETTLSSWQLPYRCDDVTLVVSELVTNALRHALPASPEGLQHGRGEELGRHGTREEYDAYGYHQYGAYNGYTAYAEHGARGELAVRQSEYDVPVRLHLMRWASRLVCAVRDPSQEAPVSETGSINAFPGLADFADDQAESGRGLLLVEAFSDSWGWEMMGGASAGKVVWALFRLPTVDHLTA